MKNILTAAFAVAVLLAASSAFAAPAANQQGPAYYGGRDYNQGYRPGYRAPYYRPAAYYRPGYYRAPAPVRYSRAPRYGYVPAPPVYAPPVYAPPRRPAAVAIRIHL